MRLIDRYICRQVFSHAFLGLGIFTFVFFVPQLVRLMDLVVRHPGSWSTIAILFLSTFPGILSFTLPIGVLVGVLIALGRLSADSELIAMSALGMGRRRLLVPVGILARRRHGHHFRHDALARSSFGAHLPHASKTACAPGRLPIRWLRASSMNDSPEWSST